MASAAILRCADLRPNTLINVLPAFLVPAVNRVLHLPPVFPVVI